MKTFRRRLNDVKFKINKVDRKRNTIGNNGNQIIKSFFITYFITFSYSCKDFTSRWIYRFESFSGYSINEFIVNENLKEIKLT